MRAPNCRRRLPRAASTSRIAAEAASAVSPNISSSRPTTSVPLMVSLPIIRRLIVKLLQQRAQLCDVRFAQLLLLAEMRHQWCYAAAEQALDQAFALRADVVLARHRRRVAVAPAFGFGLHRALLQQAVE